MVSILKKQPHLPKHIAIIMDGNGRWANKRYLPRAAGHKKGVKTLRKIVEHAVKLEIKILTVYAFSSDNWHRPEKEVSILMNLFVTALKEQVKDLHRNKVNVRFIGDRSAFSDKLQGSISNTELLTSKNDGLRLVVAVSYGGRWDIIFTCRKIAAMIEQGELKACDVDENLINQTISLGDCPQPDLFIRTGGEKRLSNFLLWQLAYSELYFTDILWPDFIPEKLNEAIDWFSVRQRRFGKTSEQI